MYIIQDVESGLVFKISPDHKVNEMSIETIPANNNLFVIGIIDFNVSFLNIRSEKFFENHVDHEYDTNSLFFLPMTIL